MNAASGPVASHQADTPVIPASTQKLLTSAAALAVLGPDTTLEHARRRCRADPQNGTVDRLCLVGGGDPLLSTADFRAALNLETDHREPPDDASSRTSPTRSWPRACTASPAASSATTPGTTDLRYLPDVGPSYQTDGSDRSARSADA